MAMIYDRESKQNKISARKRCMGGSVRSSLSDRAVCFTASLLATWSERVLLVLWEGPKQMPSLVHQHPAWRGLAPVMNETSDVLDPSRVSVLLWDFFMSRVTLCHPNCMHLYGSGWATNQ